MNEERVERIRRIHAGAIELDPRERGAFLDLECGEDDALRQEAESLIAAYDRMGGFLEQAAPDRLNRIVPEGRAFAPGKRIGSYEVVGVIGAGGAGTVYEAIQARPHRRVALKVMRINLGSEAAQRHFEDEAEILARLKHPGIATVYEAGVHDGLPYFALEYVEGARSLLEFARTGDLSDRRRLELFAQVCDAVHHGHQKGIVHRDLKPGNVLVDASGRPKIIDFGIAHAEDRESTPGEFAGTLAYMSPEQCDPSVREIDVRSDIYALGVVLYELLTGELPYEVTGETITDATRVIRERAPAPLDTKWRGDIEAILGKALRKDREARYASAAALADDIRRHLTDRPVEAHPHGHLYVWQKFARRQRVAFVSIALVLLVSISAAVSGVWLAVERDRERKRAEFQAYVANIAAAAAELRLNDTVGARQCLERTPERLRNWEWSHLRGRLDTSRRTIHWPSREIFTGALSPDGVLAVASDRRTVRVWNVARGEVLVTYDTGSRRVDALAIGPRHRRLAAGYFDGGVEIRDAESGVRESTIDAHESGINAIAFDPTGDRLATASTDRTVKLWSTATALLLGTFAGHEDRVISVAFGPRGKRLASGGRDAAIRIWDVSSGELLRVLTGHGGSVEDVAWSADGSRIVSASRDRTVRLWNPSTGETLAVGRGHTDNVRAVAFSPDGRTFASASYDKTLRIWSTRDGKEIACLRGHARLLRAVGYSPDGQRIVSFSRDGTIKIWDAARKENVFSLTGHEDQVNAIAFSPEGRRLASASRDRMVRLWDLQSASVIRILEGHRGPVLSVVFTPDGSRLASASANGEIRIWSLPEGDPIRTLAASAAQCSAFDPQGRRSYLGTVGGRVSVVDLETGRRTAHRQIHRRQVTALVLDATGRILASGSGAGALGLWDAATLEPLAASQTRGGSVNRLAFTHDGSLLAAGLSDGTVGLLDARTLETRATLSGHSDRVLGLAFSPDGTRLVSGSRDGTTRLWDLVSGAQVAVLSGQGQPVRCLTFDADGRRVAAGDGNWEVPGVVTLWEANPH